MGVLDGLPPEVRPVLDELDPATLERFRQFDETLQAGHSHRYPDDSRLRPLAVDDAGWRAMALWTQLALRTTDGSMPSFDVLRSLAQRKIGWTARERELLWRTTLAAPDPGRLHELPISAVKDLPAAELGPLLPQLRQAQRELDQVPFADLWPAKRTLDILLSEHPTGEPGEATRSLVPEHDGFAALVRGKYSERLEVPEVLPILRHWVTATSPDPTPKWPAKARELLTPEAVALAREILGCLPAHRESLWNTGYRDEITYLHQRTAELVRGMVWTCELIDEPWVAGLLGDVAVATGTGMGGSGPNSRSERVANAALGALSRRGGLEVVPQLARVQAKVRKKSILAKVSRTLDAVAVRTGLSPERLLERTVPTFGLSPDGTRSEQGLTLSLNGTITFNGRKTIPKSVDRALLAEFKATAKELKKALPAERFRVERALASERLWRWHEVCEFYLDHPVTGFFARTLIWEILQGPAGLPVLVDGAWELTDPAGRRIQPRPDTPVLLWHPISHTADEVRAWRDHLMAIGLRQPYKQAFRELYLLTPAEEQTRDRSRRFSNHLLRYGQAKALLTSRNWTGMTLGHWDGAGGSGLCTATKELPGGLTAAWDFHLDEHSYERDGYGTTASICVSGDLRFISEGETVLLAEVPPLILSEALRDADLAVGVTSTGLDPNGTGDYWQSYSFGDLTESAQVRRDALTRLLPRLTIADRCTLEERFLRVRGDLRTYRIHLGSGNILMEPNDAYLCIVSGVDPHARLFLPFEEDGRLALILSKAFLLANDTAITDPSITRQIRP